jgi:hypothetical protein
MIITITEVLIVIELNKSKFSLAGLLHLVSYFGLAYLEL